MFIQSCVPVCMNAQLTLCIYSVHVMETQDVDAEAWMGEKQSIGRCGEPKR